MIFLLQCHNLFRTAMSSTPPADDPERDKSDAEEEEDGGEEEDYAEEEDDYDDYADYYDGHDSSLAMAKGPKAQAQLSKFSTRLKTAEAYDPASADRVSHAVRTAMRTSDQQHDAARARDREKSDRATVDQVLDPRTRLILFKMLNAGIAQEVNGCISTGKEAHVYHAVAKDGSDLAIKIYNTSVLVFKDRDRYVTGEHRFRNGYCKSNPRKMVKLWAEKEMRNLKRLSGAGIPCPLPVLLRDHVLVMQFIGDDGWPAPRLKDATMSDVKMRDCYRQCLKAMRMMYHQCKLVHADLSEFNMLYFQSTLYIIDVSQSVEHDHPQAVEFLKKDCENVCDFFTKNGVTTLSLRELFEFVTTVAVSKGDNDFDAEFLDLVLERVGARSAATQALARREDDHFKATYQAPVQAHARDMRDMERQGEAAAAATQSELISGVVRRLTGAVEDADTASTPFAAAVAAAVLPSTSAPVTATLAASPSSPLALSAAAVPARVPVAPAAPEPDMSHLPAALLAMLPKLQYQKKLAAAAPSSVRWSCSFLHSLRGRVYVTGFLFSREHQVVAPVAVPVRRIVRVSHATTFSRLAPVTEADLDAMFARSAADAGEEEHDDEMGAVDDATDAGNDSDGLPRQSAMAAGSDRTASDDSDDDSSSGDSSDSEEKDLSGKTASERAARKANKKQVKAANREKRKTKLPKKEKKRKMNARKR